MSQNNNLLLAGSSDERSSQMRNSQDLESVELLGPSEEEDVLKMNAGEEP